MTMNRRSLFAAIGALIAAPAVAKAAAIAGASPEPAMPVFDVPVGSIYMFHVCPPNPTANYDRPVAGIAVYRVKADDGEWLDCDGMPYRAASYPQLAKVLNGEQAGEWFHVPRLHRPDWEGSGAAFSDHSHSLSSAALPSHTHSFAQQYINERRSGYLGRQGHG
jgi:hypothetical protein